MINYQKKELIRYLLQQVTQHKRDRIACVLGHRTRHVTIALENLYQQHNAAAALRTAECFGVQDVHIIESGNSFKPAVGVALGSPAWLDVHRYAQAEECVARLKKNNYQIIATSPHATACTLYDIPLDRKVALFFGTEDNGLSPYVFEHADTYAVIPMYGFTESYNVSVSVALCLQVLITRLHGGDDFWKLSESEQDDLLLVWLKKIIPQSQVHERVFLKALSQA